MNLLSIAENYTQLKRKSAKEWAGPCPSCGGSDRFMVWPERGRWYCRGCEMSGNTVMFLHQFGGMSCPDAHEACSESCTNRSCPAWDGCRLGAKANGEAPQKKKRESLTLPAQAENLQFVPGQADSPQDKWQAQAAALIEKSHARLMEDLETMAYLANRGLPIGAVEEFKLGLLPENRYPERESWGLPTELKGDGKPKKMFLPAGILIPFFAADGQPHRLRIRRIDPRPGDPRYYWVPGSGNDVPVIGPKDARGVVVVESDLDGLMVRWQCRDLDICTLPLGTVSAKPKDWAFNACQNALAILVALDCEPRINEKTGLPENPGGEASRWWLDQFRRAVRWPVPGDKDPGEYFETGGDVRAWVLSGLPPVFKVPKGQSESESKITKLDDHRPGPDHITGRTINGLLYVVTKDARQVYRLREKYPDGVVFTQGEIDKMVAATLTKAQSEQALIYRKSGGRTEHFIKYLANETGDVLGLINSAAQIFGGTIEATGEIDRDRDYDAPGPGIVEKEKLIFGEKTRRRS